MKKATLEKELIKAGKELRAIEQGKLVAEPLDNIISEMRKKHGGKRAGAGRKTDVKKTKYIRVTPAEKDLIQKIRKTKENFTKHDKPLVITIPALTRKETKVSITV